MVASLVTQRRAKRTAARQRGDRPYKPRPGSFAAAVYAAVAALSAKAGVTAARVEARLRKSQNTAWPTQPNPVSRALNSLLRERVVQRVGHTQDTGEALYKLA